MAVNSINKKGVHCTFCGSSEFNYKTSFRGTADICKDSFYMYARCVSCCSIQNISGELVDYTNYASGKKIFPLRTNRFIRFLEKNGFSKDDSILDYGCGSGVFAQSLRNRGYNVFGYEPYNPELNNTIKSTNKFSLVYLIQVFEHISNFKEFFNKLNSVTLSGSKILTIHPSSTRIGKLDPNDALQCWTIHAPYHYCIPSDKATINLFSDNGYSLLSCIEYDIQRSGFFENNNVSALLRQKFGGTREGLIAATNSSRILTYLSSPLAFLNAWMISTKDRSVSTFIFQRD